MSAIRLVKQKKQSASACSAIKVLLLTSVPDLKLLITDPYQDPDPQIENQEIRILLLTRDGDKSFQFWFI